MVPFMVSCPSFYITLNPPSTNKFLPYPIYTVGMDLNACVQVFYRSIEANGKKNDVDIINLFCFTFRDATFKWGEIFIKAHLVCIFEELEVTFCKCYQKL